jgi:serine/threonine-protein kinase
LLRQGLLPLERARQIALDLCDALIRAHRLKIIHRDIKPENVLIDQHGTPKLADFGVARLSEDTQPMTRSGTQVGTPYYMAPEAWEGEKLDAQADIWSLGVVLFEMLTGQLPFRGDTPVAVMNKVCTTPPPDLKELRAEVPLSLAEIVNRMLTRDKRRRYPTMREVAVDLERDQERNAVKADPDDINLAGTHPDRVLMPTRTSPVDAPPIAKRGFGGVKRRAAEGKRGSLDPRLLIAIGVIALAAIFGVPPLIRSFESIPAATTTLTPVLTPTVTLASTLTVVPSPSSLPSVTPSATPSVPPTPVPTALPPEIIQQGARMVLIPAGTFTMGSQSGDPNEKPPHKVSLDAFYMDRFEVTNKLYKLCEKDGACSLPISTSKYNNAKYANHPVVFTDWNRAINYCRWRGARLPTEAEWEYAARGTDGRTYPWGEGIDGSRANFQQKVNDTTAVGSYESGKSPFGMYDMGGNAWEWVNDFYSETYYQESPASNPPGPATGQLHVLRGGSWNYNDLFIRASYRNRDAADTGFNDFGFRCAFSTPQASVPPTSEVQVSARDGMKLHFVPAGSFLMGSENGDEDEKPVHKVTLDAFYIDETEITNRMYALCVADRNCPPPSNKSSFTRTHYHDDPQFADYPVIYVSWDNANAYCSWAGRKLPSEAQWEYAARGTDNRTHPWGNQAPSSALLNFNSNVGDTSQVGTFPAGVSPFGALDMAGNVWEWVSDFYDETYYAASPPSNPLGPDSGDTRALRGGSWNNFVDGVRSANRFRFIPDVTDYFVGFRCALSAATLTPGLVASAAKQPLPATATSTPAPTQTSTSASTGNVILSEKDGMKLHFVPAGSFLMGSENGDKDEKPVHKVTLDAFYIDETEITNRMYLLCEKAGACQPPIDKSSSMHKSYHDNAQYADYPVVYVSWSDAKTYCQWAGRALPSEAQWEKAARGTDGRTYPWGNSTLDKDLLNYNDNIGDTTEVGIYPNGKSPYGAYDMAGNVWEWVSDWYEYDYYAKSPAFNPFGPASGQDHLIRGGAWTVNGCDLRSADRCSISPVVGYTDLGFRCALVST